MSSKAKVISRQIIKPSSPTPNHLKDFKISLLDQLAPPHYIPIVLFYTASDISNDFGANAKSKTISDKLKTSLSDVLTLYYPLCGRLKGNFSVECNDEGVLYMESKFPTTNLSDVLKKPLPHQIKEFLPFEPYITGGEHHEVPTWSMAVQFNEFNCGGIGLGVCLLHKIVDTASAVSFLNAWAATARGHGNNIATPRLDASSFFPPIIDIELDMSRIVTGKEKFVTKRFVFDETNLSRLRATLGGFKPTRVEAVASLIWKSALEAAKKSLGELNETFKPSMVSQAVNIGSRMVPPLPKDLFGNIWLYCFSPLVGDDGTGAAELHDLAEMVRKTISGVDADYLRKLQGNELVDVLESFMKAKMEIMENDIPCYGFSSWTRFGFYEVDFGWGKPTWVATLSMAVKNTVILMVTKNGDGIEAWMSMSEHDMKEFERSPKLLEFASFDG